MAPTRDSNLTIIERMQRESEFTRLSLEESVVLFLDGEADVARLILRNIVKATMGFELLARKINKPSKSIHRMLSLKGNPSMDNISSIFAALRQHLYKKRNTQVHYAKAA